MKTRKFLWALLPVAAVLLMTACGGDDADDVTPTPTPNPVTPGTENVVKSVPYTVTVKTADVTRTSVDNDGETLSFEKDDKLYVQNSNGTIYGCLSLKAGAGQTSATFAGYVNYTGSTPPANTPLTATLVGSGNLLGMIGDDGKVKADNQISIPATPCESMSEAVQKYSWIRGDDGTYGTPTFTLKQRTAFMMFNITLEDGTKGDVNVPVEITNITNGSGTYKFNVTTTGEQFSALASFVFPFADGTVIAGDASMCIANVSDEGSIRIGTGSAVTLTGGKVYPVTRTKDFVRLWDEGPVWSTRNLGASSVTGYGDFYAWGETTGYSSVYAETMTDHNFSWTNYTLCNGTSTSLKRYNATDGKKELVAADDAATKKPGSSWRMPTGTDFDNLLSETKGEWTTITFAGSNVSGGTFTGKTGGYTGKAIFLPAAGFRGSNKLYNQGTNVGYWSSSLDTSTSGYTNGRTLTFNSGDNNANMSSAVRYGGRSIRPVRDN